MMTSTDRHTESRIKVVAFPWLVPASTCLDVAKGRGFLLAEGSVNAAHISLCDDSLPLLGRCQDAAGQCWTRFALPSGQLNDFDTRANESFVATVQSKNGHLRHDGLTLPGYLPTPELAAQFRKRVLSDDNEQLRDLVSQSLIVQQLIDSHIDFVNRIYDESSADETNSDGTAGGIAIRSVCRTVSEWLAVADKDEPRISLIVKIAKNYSGRIADVCNRPRRVLKRIRTQQRIHRIQEIDHTCLAYLTRQPGRSVAERAGPKQRLLGIARTEDVDTPENRVVCDLVRRATVECRRYVLDHQRFPVHPLVKLVEKLGQQLDDHMRRSPIKEARKLSGIAQPNYVLQHDSRYQPLWPLYLKLVRQQKQQDKLWRWRERTWSEHCGLAILAALVDIWSETSVPRFDILLRDEQNAGCFTDQQTQFGSLPASSPSGLPRVDVVPGLLSSRHPDISPALSELCPDFVLVAHSPLGRNRPPLNVAIWTVLDAESEKNARRAGESLAGSLGTASLPNNVRALLMCPSTNNEPSDIQCGTGMGCKVVRVAIPLQRQLATIRSLLREGLGLR